MHSPRPLRERQAAAELLVGADRAFRRPSEDLIDVLTAVLALVLVRIEDLGGDAMRERGRLAMLGTHPGDGWSGYPV